MVLTADVVYSTSILQKCFPNRHEFDNLTFLPLGWNVPSSYSDVVSCYWSSYPSPSESTYYILAFCYIVVGIIGFIGNFMVIFMLARFDFYGTWISN